MIQVAPDVVPDRDRPNDPYAEDIKNALTTEGLVGLLVAIQDGQVEYGAADCELIGEIICEVLELRKKNVAQQKEIEELSRARYKGSKMEGRWERRHDVDCWALYAPDGRQLARISGLEEIQHKSPDDFKRHMKEVERRAMREWCRQHAVYLDEYS